MASIRQLYVNLNLRADNFNNQLRSAQREAKEFQRTIQPSIRALNDMGRTATAAGGAMTAGLTVPLAAAATLSVKAASDFESSFAGIRKTVDGVVASGGGLTEFGQELQQQMRDLAKTIPISVNELNKIGEAAGQLGIKKDSIVQFTETMALLGETTNLTSDQAATATANIQNIFGAAGKDVDRFGATLVALGNAGASTEADIIEMAKRIAGTGHLVGLTQAQVLSFASALSSVGINAEAGGSAISRVFLKMNNAVADGGKSLNEFARIAGMDAAAFKKAFQTDAAGATVAFISGLQRLKGEGENVNATIEGVIGRSIIIKDTLLRASGAGDMLTSTLQLGNQAWQENSALIKEAEQRHATFKSQLQLLWNVVNDVAITLGAVLIPILLNVLQGLRPVIAVVAQLAEWFSKLPVPVQTVVVVIAALVAAVGPLLLAFGLAATSIAALIPAITGLVAFLGTVGGPILLIVAAIGVWVAAITGAAGVLIAFIASNEEMRNAVGEAWAQIKVAALDLWASVSEIFGDLAADIKVLWGQVGPDVLFVFTNMVKVAAEMLKNLASIVATGLKVISGAVQAFHGLVTGDASKFSAGIQKIWKALWDAIKGLVGTYLNSLKLSITGFTEKVSNAFKAMYDAVVGNSYVPDMIDGIRDAFGMLDEYMVDPTRRAANGVMSTFKNMFDTVLSFARDWKGTLKNMLGDFLGGINLGEILKGDLGSILQSAKDVLGIGGGGSRGGGAGGIGGVFGGAGGGQAASGIMGALNPISAGFNIASGAFALGTGITGMIGKGRDSANEVVKSQNAFEKTLDVILKDTGLSATNKLKQIDNVWAAFQANLARFSAAGGEGGVTANQSFATLSPLVTQIRNDQIKAGASDGSTGNGGGNTFNFYVTANNAEELVRIIQLNVGGVRTEIIKAADLGEGLVTAH